ncbi:hypothetical protein PMAYCL1PPCAC_28852, partial [Pristionchus mayeri]
MTQRGVKSSSIRHFDLTREEIASFRERNKMNRVSLEYPLVEVEYRRIFSVLSDSSTFTCRQECPRVPEELSSSRYSSAPHCQHNSSARMREVNSLETKSSPLPLSNV